MNALVVTHMRPAQFLARRLCRSRPWLTDDAEQAAMVGLLAAADKFDPGAGVLFWTYAKHWVRAKVAIEIHLLANAAHVPAHGQEWVSSCDIDGNEHGRPLAEVIRDGSPSPEDVACLTLAIGKLASLDRDVVVRRLTGEPCAAIAVDHGVSGTWINKRWEAARHQLGLAECREVTP